MASFIHTRALSADLPEIIDVEFRAFTNPVLQEIFMGHDTSAGRRALAEKYAGYMKTDFSDYWTKVVDPATGKIIAASNWKIYQSATPDHDKTDITTPWLEGQPEKLKRARRALDVMIQTRKRLMTEPYLQLHICFVDPAYHRKGVGSLMLSWGCELADLLALPAWVEASPDGKHLYKVFGFEPVDSEGAEGEALHGITMKRPSCMSSR